MSRLPSAWSSQSPSATGAGPTATSEGPGRDVQPGLAVRPTSVWSCGVTATLASQQNRKKKLKIETSNQRSWQPRAATRGARRQDSCPRSSGCQHATFQELKSGCVESGADPTEWQHCTLISFKGTTMCVTPAPCRPWDLASVTPPALLTSGPALTSGSVSSYTLCWPLEGPPALPRIFSGELTSVSLPRAGLGIGGPWDPRLLVGVPPDSCSGVFTPPPVPHSHLPRFFSQCSLLSDLRRQPPAQVISEEMRSGYKRGSCPLGWLCPRPQRRATGVPRPRLTVCSWVCSPLLMIPAAQNWQSFEACDQTACGRGRRVQLT